MNIIAKEVIRNHTITIEEIDGSYLVSERTESGKRCLGHFYNYASDASRDYECRIDAHKRYK